MKRQWFFQVQCCFLFILDPVMLKIHFDLLSCFTISCFWYPHLLGNKLCQANNHIRGWNMSLEWWMELLTLIICDMIIGCAFKFSTQLNLKQLILRSRYGVCVVRNIFAVRRVPTVREILPRYVWCTGGVGEHFSRLSLRHCVRHVRRPAPYHTGQHRPGPGFRKHSLPFLRVSVSSVLVDGYFYTCGAVIADRHRACQMACDDH